METLCVLGLFLAVSFWSAHGSGSGCQDIDHDACVAMANQNSKLCSDQILARTACPAYCKNCPVTCYRCNTTSADISQCNTVTCAAGEMCLLKTVSGTARTDRHSMMCGTPLICSTRRKRNLQFSKFIGLQPRGTLINLKCCDSDLCNTPSQPLTTKKTTVTTKTRPAATTTTTTTTTTSAPTTRLTHSFLPCQRDVIIMLEDSIGIAGNYGDIKSAIADVISHLDIGPDRTRVALGTFSHSGKKRWDLDSHMDKASLLSAINHLSPQNWEINADNLVAIEFVLHQFSQGNRATAPDDVIFISEGHSFVISNYVREAAAIQSLHQKSSNVITIALGSADQTELHYISSDNNHFFYIPDISHFDHSLLANVLNLVDCK